MAEAARALDDGTAAEPRFLGYGRQSLNADDVAAVVEVLQSDFLTQGPVVPQFEAAIAEYVGAHYAVAVSSGTAALHLACLAAGLETGDHGVTQPITFVASANAMAYCNATSHLVDIDADTLTMGTGLLADHLAKMPETKVVMPVSFAGLASDGAERRSVCGERTIIEDNSHSLGARESCGAMVGACTHADMSVFSFHPVKPITTCEGGAITTNDPDLYARLAALRTHGIVRGHEAVRNPSDADDPWYYEQQALGLNYRLPDVQAALGLSQLGRIDAFIARRREIALRYDRLLAACPHLRLIQAAPEQRQRSGHHLYLVDIDYSSAGTDRKTVMERLRARRIGTQVHYIPVHHHPWHRDRMGLGAGAMPVSERYYAGCLSIPC
ncbi:MAG: UDP-4-amino-4,6-dideoxy-N-acetyl-beta-L-altrosamine transaminase, partial [Pseudomonadota bacterium]